MNNFAIFITSHERVNNCVTYDTLKRLNCTYPTYIIIDDLDKQKDEYLEKYKGFVKVFNKEEISKSIDTIMNPKIMSAVIYAREYCEQLAKEMNLDYFLVMDDDIKDFQIRYPIKDKLVSCKIHNFNSILDIYKEFLDTTSIGMLGFGTNASYMGGVDGLFKNKRRVFNAFFRKVKIPFRWISNFCEDSISSLVNGQVGFISLEVPLVQLMAISTGKGTSIGGMWEMYNKVSEFNRKYCYVIAQPSVYSITITQEKLKINRLWDNALPKVLENKYKK